ncbi:MAG: zinc ribbon domain-containing protein [Polyangiaceae bacterium]
MSIPNQIRALEELAAFDADIKVMDEQLANERSTLNGLKGSLKRLEDKIAADRVTVGAMEKQRNELIADVRQMMTQLDHSREKMNRARTERETNAVQRELEELRKLIRDREDEIGKLTTDSDAQRLTLEATEAEAKKIQDELNAREGDINSTLASLEKQRATKQASRDEVVKRLPPVLYRRYDAVRARRGSGIAQTTDGTCKACNMSLPPQLFHRLRREPLLEQCPSCNRIIYYAPPPSAAVEEDRK